MPTRRDVMFGALGAGAGVTAGSLLGKEGEEPTAPGAPGAPAATDAGWTADVRAFGAKGDGVADDTAAIQQALDTTLGDEATIRAGRIRFPKGIYRITDTVTVTQASAVLEGVGWSSSNVGDEATRGSVLVWDGPQERPMLRLDYCWGCQVSGIRFVGKSSSKPSAAIALRNQSTNPSGSDFNQLSRIWIGSMSGYDTDTLANQFANGVLLEGDNVNGDTNRFDQLVIFGCDVGVNITQQQFVRNHFSMLRVVGCRTAFRTNATISTSGDNWVLSRSSVSDIELGLAARLRVHGFSSESSRRLVTSQAGALMLSDGYWQLGPEMAPDGLIVDGRGGSGRSFLRIEDFDFTESGPVPGRIAWDPANQIFLSNVSGI